MAIQQLSPVALPAALQAALAAGRPLVLLDVREDVEIELAALPGITHIPLHALARRVGELDPDRPTVCICHHGVRSMSAARFLADQGFDELYNLAGGIDRYSLDVDPRLPRY
jgi:rhodanese-related sulfurtransferase